MPLKIAMIWHQQDLAAKKIANEYNWLFIDSQQCLQQTNLHEVEQIIIQSELPWNDIPTNKFTGIKLAYHLSINNYLLSNRIIIVSKFSNSFLKEQYPLFYVKALVHSKALIEHNDFWEFKNPLGIKIRANILKDQCNEALHNIFFDYNSHNNIPDLIDVTLTELETLNLVVSQRSSYITALSQLKHAIGKKLLPLLWKIKIYYAYFNIKKNNSLTFPLIVKNKSRFKILVQMIDELIHLYHLILKLQDIKDKQKILNQAKKLKQNLTLLSNVFFEIKSL